MKTKTNEFAKISELARTLENEIDKNDLLPGDPFFSASGAARFLSVAVSTANRALQLLEKRRLIARHQRSGSVILAREPQNSRQAVKTCFLVHEKYLQLEGIGNDGILSGIQDECPWWSVEHCFLVPGHEEDQVDALIRNSLGSGFTETFVMVRAPFAVQRLIEQSRLPAVIHGTRYPGIEKIPMLERDHDEVIVQIVSHLRLKKRNDIVFLGRELVLPGDQLVLDRLYRSICGLRPPVFLPASDLCIRSVIKKMLSQPSVPDAFLCATRRQAECVCQEIKQKGLLPGRDIDIILLYYYGPAADKPPYHFILSDNSPEQIGRRIGQMLVRQLMRVPVADVTVPVRFV